ncbi:MAG: putative peptide zinc metalloprotease protein, partial [Solirubrobacteraceae bacterium]|nr:putative peptide zinc metalloprotease protein [Solirubrobacteraceae bacterium]
MGRPSAAAPRVLTPTLATADLTTAEPPSPAEPPLRLADGIELVGEFKDSGFKTPPWIVRRSDGQVVQLPRLLYLIAERADGSRTHEEIGAEVSEAVQRGVDGNAVGMLAENLRELGVLAARDGSSPEIEKLDPLLALKFRTSVVPERITHALTTIFKPLFASPIVVVVVLGLIGLDAWLLAVHGIDAGLRAVIYNPALLLVLLAGVVLATAFHETGHASACRYGGATPGVMGVGIYVVWPAFYTDVTDAYRLGKAGRLRTDLGGIYFNAIFALAMGGLFALTGFEPLLLLVLIQNFAMLQQLLPLLRLDGYYIISDHTGVPDMFTRIKPVLQSLISGREPSDRVTELKPWVRRVVTGYVMFVVPLLLLSFVLMVLHAPRAFATAYDSIGVQWDKVSNAKGIAEGLAGVLQLAALVLPSVGMVLTGGRVGTRASAAAWAWSAGEPLRRGGLATVAAAGIGLVAFTWWPNGDYRPIQPGEKGTIQGAVASIAQIPSGRPALTAQRSAQLGGAPSERDVRSGKAKRNAVAQGDQQASGTDRTPNTTTGAEPTPTATPRASATPG